MSDTLRPLCLDTLLAQRPWVERLARRLVLDDATADDVVQQTWLAALESPPREASSLRVWLARVARNEALQSHRRAARRSRYEALAPVHEPPSSPEQTVARAEAHRRVVDAVLSLDEPYRAAVLLRFFEGLGSAEVARRTGVPVETARTRIKRALALLRGRLDRDHGGDGRQWALALLPLTSGRKGIATSAAIGGTVMAGTVKLALAGAAGAVVGALVTVGAVRGTAPPAVEPPSAVPETAAAPKTRRRPHPAPETSPSPVQDAAPPATNLLARLFDETPVDLPPTSAATISGRVRTRVGEPVPGAIVRAAAVRRTDAGVATPATASAEDEVRAAVVAAKWRTATLREATTDAAGAFVLAGISDAPQSITASAPGFEIRPSSGANARAVRPGATIDFVAMSLADLRSKTSERAATAVKEALGWLRDRQTVDGRWTDPGATGAAILPFVGSGETHQNGASRESVRAGLDALRAGQETDGALAPAASPAQLRDHAVAGLALVESFAMTDSRALKEPAQRTVAYALKTRTPGQAWSRTTAGGEIDIETTGFMVMLLKSAQVSGLDVDAAALHEAVAALDRLTDPATGRIDASSDAGATAMSGDAATAIGLLARLYDRRTAKGDPVVARAIESMAARPPSADTPDLACWYFGTLAMFQVGGEPWEKWFAAVRDAVLGRTDAAAARAAWWDAVGASAPEPDRVWATSLSCLCAEVVGRYARTTEK